jgi:hypothetical protein
MKSVLITGASKGLDRSRGNPLRIFWLPFKGFLLNRQCRDPDWKLRGIKFANREG